jgi:acyl-coenzyme A thioesterase PaaI-like protein
MTETAASKPAPAPGVVDADTWFAKEPDGSGAWSVDVLEDHLGAFGGTFGGFIAAYCVNVARASDLDKTPFAVDAHFHRPLPVGRAQFVPNVVHSGRSLINVEVDVHAPDGRLASRVTVSLVAPGSLKNRDHAGADAAPPEVRSYEEGKPFRQPPGMRAPILDTFAPRAVGRSARGSGTAIPRPWSGSTHGVEAACLAADLSVGSPVALAFRDDPTPSPNPNIGLRLVTDEVGPHVLSMARLERIRSGVATIGIEIWSGDDFVGVGACSSLLVR